MQVLVTGDAGLISSHLAEALLEAGHSVTILDNLDAFYAVDLKQRNIDRRCEADAERFRFVDGSITNETAVEAMFADVVFHQAAKAGVRTSMENSKKPHRVNTLRYSHCLGLQLIGRVSHYFRGSSQNR